MNIILKQGFMVSMNYIIIFKHLLLLSSWHLFCECFSYVFSAPCFVYRPPLPIESPPRTNTGGTTYLELGHKHTGPGIFQHNSQVSFNRPGASRTQQEETSSDSNDVENEDDDPPYATIGSLLPSRPQQSEGNINNSPNRKERHHNRANFFDSDEDSGNQNQNANDAVTFGANGVKSEPQGTGNM